MIRRGSYSGDARIGWLEWLPWVLAVAVFFALPEYLPLGARILVFILFALSLDLILGYGGVITLGHTAFFGLGGALGAEILTVQPIYPFEHLVYFLIVVAVGGLGSLRGPFIAALLIGITDTACKYWVPQFGSFFIYVATIAILLWRPAGLFGAAHK